MSKAVVTPRLVVFDGFCNVCSGWARFLARHDVRPPFHPIPMQSAEGRALLTDHGIDADDPLSFLVVDGGKTYVKSDATIHLLAEAGRTWGLIRPGRLVPRTVRDGLYLLVARNRYKWFGRRTTCFLPDSQSELNQTSAEADERGRS
jgi:predicted DCC family thiol-disulfide oxidoreductase YuxK